jgi:hypothetical protein
MTRHAIGIRDDGPATGAADWLCLAATPTFAAMALASSVFAGGPQDMICAAAHGTSPLTGMTCMYLLMGAFHSAPWLRLLRRHSIPQHPTTE